MSELGFIRVKGIALAVSDLDRANRFYGETLALPPDTIRNMESAYLIGDASSGWGTSRRRSALHTAMFENVVLESLACHPNTDPEDVGLC